MGPVVAATRSRAVTAARPWISSPRSTGWQFAVARRALSSRGPRWDHVKRMVVLAHITIYISIEHAPREHMLSRGCRLEPRIWIVARECVARHVITPRCSILARRQVGGLRDRPRRSRLHVLGCSRCGGSSSSRRTRHVRGGRGVPGAPRLAECGGSAGRRARPGRRGRQRSRSGLAGVARPVWFA